MLYGALKCYAATSHELHGVWNHQQPHTCQSYPGYFWKPHWLSMGLAEISRVTLIGMQSECLFNSLLELSWKKKKKKNNPSPFCKPFVRGLHWWLVVSFTKGQQHREHFYVMTSSCNMVKQRSNTGIHHTPHPTEKGKERTKILWYTPRILPLQVI